MHNFSENFTWVLLDISAGYFYNEFHKLSQETFQQKLLEKSLQDLQRGSTFLKLLKEHPKSRDNFWLGFQGEFRESREYTRKCLENTLQEITGEKYRQKFLQEFQKACRKIS